MIKGSIVALITPMNEEGSVDYAGLEKLIQFHLRLGFIPLVIQYHSCQLLSVQEILKTVLLIAVIEKRAL